MKVKELIRLLQGYNEEDNVELLCYSMDCVTVELSVEPCGDLLMEDDVKWKGMMIVIKHWLITG